MSAALNPGRRVVHGGAYGYVVYSTPAQRMPHAEWSLWFERRALLQGYTAVIDGQVIEPGTTAARAAIAKATGGAT